ncbi:fatty acid CoA ligase family protein [Rhodococcus tukisamuensis]|uniref:Acyl-CoA synthetase (AMP-forming)/AMP-acid ligase II n=1 Tax=Rhodococcus tukisamuensis TaxID=168276 RepID=A0A1G6Z3T6_9NOCA|nr:fatty acid CoA ligase family protein [Rhodococcus tukisamuensis]SDD97152.1 Acyl-CoA synthetase (AMP-forming)/AMP-acid ligase II [Rhodococcus tukisamuensis]
MSAALTDNWLDRLTATARRRPGAPAVTSAAGAAAEGLPDYADVTFGELDEWSDALAQRFAAAGMTAGVRTIVLVNPGPELYAILFGLFKTGAVPVVIDPGMGLRPMLRCLAAVDPQAFVGLPQAHAVRVLFRRGFRGVGAKVTVGRRWFWGGHTLAGLGRKPVGERPPTAPAGDDELLMIAFTTGSTGPAKAVELTHGNLAAMLAQTQAVTAVTAEESALVTLPMFGVLYLLLGAQVVLPPLVPSKVGDTDPRHVVDAVNRFRVRTMFASPALLGPLLDHARTHEVVMPTVRAVFSGGAPVPAAVVTGLREVLSADAQVHAGYGATEAIPMSTIESRELLDGLIERAQSGDGTCIGRPVDGVEVRVIAVTDAPLEGWAQAQPLRGAIGELVVSGPNVSTRYHWPAAANLTGKIADGDRTWHRTGDLGRIDDEGRIWFCGRKSQRVETGAVTLHPVQVEQVFNAAPGVARTALVGVGDRGAQRPVLCVETSPGADAAAVLDGLRERGARFPLTAQIDRFLVHPQFPVDIRHNAKIGREELAVWAATRLTRGAQS